MCRFESAREADIVGNDMGKNIVMILFIVQLIALNAALFYVGGIKRYGTPAQFKAKQELAAKAVRDSIKLAEMEEISPENAADSVMYDIGRHIRLFEKTEAYEARIQQLQASLDSLKREKESLDKLEASVTQKENLLKMVQDQARTQNMASLAKMFDAMKVQQAVPVITEVSDTLAVSILTRMQNRNSAKLLGAIAAVDTAKAVKLSRMIARMGTLEAK